MLPTALPLLLAVFISAISVQDVPLYCSTLSIIDGDGLSPPATMLAVKIPKPEDDFLTVFKSPPDDQDPPPIPPSTLLHLVVIHLK